MGKPYTIRLDENALGQLLDGLRCRAEAWHGTAKYFETGKTPHENFLIEDCNDTEEARKIAADYDRLIAEIEDQMQSQRAAS
ncbi:MAG: hypothetical protein ABII82_18365 [Verrucomicrobiota bacterium]